MQCSKESIRCAIEALAAFNTSPGNGITRFSYTPEDRKARDYLIGMCSGIGLAVREDAVGNVFARYEGTEPTLPIVMSGSHIDSVKNGGRFDGIVGSVCALEAVRVMKEEGVLPRHSIEVVFFAEEEGSSFQVPVLGSKVLVGKLSGDDLKEIKADDGRSAWEVIEAAGFHPDQIDRDILRPGAVKALLELHIEQSVRLDRERHTIGIVEGIAGLNWLEITLTGESNHAGATPMHLRSDPMAVAGSIIAEVGEMARRTAGTTVATVGRMEVIPNIPNAIPAEVRFTVDVRDIRQEGIDTVVADLVGACNRCAQQHGVSVKIDKIATSLPIQIPPYIVETLERSAQELSLDYIRMPSGAVHDSNYMAEVTDVGMIFVPSINGRSHVPEEDTSFDDIKAGADLLLKALIELSA